MDELDPLALAVCVHRTGIMDELRIYSRALTIQEIKYQANGACCACPSVTHALFLGCVRTVAQ
jgi:hypothetical protein